MSVLKAETVCVLAIVSAWDTFQNEADTCDAV